MRIGSAAAVLQEGLTYQGSLQRCGLQWCVVDHILTQKGGNCANLPGVSAEESGDRGPYQQAK